MRGEVASAFPSPAPVDPPPRVDQAALLGYLRRRLPARPLLDVGFPLGAYASDSDLDVPRASNVLRSDLDAHRLPWPVTTGAAGVAFRRLLAGTGGLAGPPRPSPPPPPRPRARS